MSAWSKTKALTVAAWDAMRKKNDKKETEKKAKRFPYMLVGASVAIVFGALLFAGGIALVATAPFTFGGGAVAGGVLMGLSGGLVAGTICIVGGLAIGGGGLIAVLQELRGGSRRRKLNRKLTGALAQDTAVIHMGDEESPPTSSIKLSRVRDEQTPSITNDSTRKVTFNENIEMTEFHTYAPPDELGKFVKQHNKTPLPKKGIIEKFSGLFSSSNKKTVPTKNEDDREKEGLHK